MLHPRLKTAHEALTRWCDQNRIFFDYCCDEDDLQGYLVPRSYRALTPRLTGFLRDLAERNGLHCCEHQTRSGTVYALSLTALSEAALEAITPAIDRSRLGRRLDLVFDMTEQVEPQIGGARPRDRSVLPIEDRLADRLRGSLGYVSVPDVVAEALDGIAADHQPGDMLKRFESALRQLGLLDRLRAAQISNKLSPDKQVLHFYLSDAEGHQREVASFELAALGEGNNMEKAIKDLSDMARKRAPGTTDRESKVIQDREKQIRDIAKSFTPQPAPEGGGIKGGGINGADAQGAGGPATVGAGGVPVEGALSKIEALLAAGRY